jgi:hypothetical protein
MPREPERPKPLPGLQEDIAEDIHRGRPGRILPATAAATPLLHYRAAPAFQAYRLLRIGFVLLLAVEGVDKFFGALARWAAFVAPQIAHELQIRLGIEVPLIVKVAGGVEVGLALLLLVVPRGGVYLMAFWLAVVTANLAFQGIYLFALQRFVLFLAALALARLVEEFRKGIDTPQDWDR